MKRADLQDARAAEARLQAIEMALKRCDSNMLNVVALIIQEKGHGIAGSDGKPQNLESRLMLDKEIALSILQTLQHDEITHLHRLGIED